MSDIVRMGVVGAGAVSQRGLLPHLTQEDIQDRVRLTSVCDTVPGRAQAAAAKYGVPHAFEDYDALLASGEVDAVTLATPIRLHYEQGKKAIERGVHVHFNKTMTTTVAEADELIALAQERGVKLVASPGEMLRPLNQQIRRLVLDGAVGVATWAMAGQAPERYHEEEPYRTGDDVLSSVDPTWYFRRPGGGPLYDVTVYPLHRLTGILGPAKRVTAFSGLRIAERSWRGEKIECDMDDNTFMLLDYGDAFFAFVYGAAAGMADFAIFGTNGRIVDGSLNGKPIDFPGKVEGGGHNVGLPHVVGPHLKIGESHVYEDAMQLVDWVREDKPSIVTAEHARHVIELFDAAYRSAETGEAQALRTTFPTVDDFGCD